MSKLFKFHRMLRLTSQLLWTDNAEESRWCGGSDTEVPSTRLVGAGIHDQRDPGRNPCMLIVLLLHK